MNTDFHFFGRKRPKRISQGNSPSKSILRIENSTFRTSFSSIFHETLLEHTPFLHSWRRWGTQNRSCWVTFHETLLKHLRDCPKIRQKAAINGILGPEVVPDEPRPGRRASLAGWPCLAARWAARAGLAGGLPGRERAPAATVAPPHSYHRRWVIWFIRDSDALCPMLKI